MWGRERQTPFSFSCCAWEVHRELYKPQAYNKTKVRLVIESWTPMLLILISYLHTQKRSASITTIWCGLLYHPVLPGIGIQMVSSDPLGCPPHGQCFKIDHTILDAINLYKLQISSSFKPKIVIENPIPFLFINFFTICLILFSRGTLSRPEAL